MKSLEPNCPVILNDGLLKNDGLNEIAVANVKALTKKNRHHFWWASQTNFGTFIRFLPTTNNSKILRIEK